MTSNPNHPRFVTLEKRIGETPLECTETWRATQPHLAGVPLAYAGRLDPMASGTLLILIGEECKHQASYHTFDKEYQFSVLLGVGSDSGDVLGIIREDQPRHPTNEAITSVLQIYTGNITLTFPIFSARTVAGKPLHTWAMEGKLSEITIPKKSSVVYHLSLTSVTLRSRTDVYTEALQKIDSLPPVTDPRKALGNDFRRPDVKASWERFRNTGTLTDTFMILNLTCIASSGTYMRSLAEAIGHSLDTTGLAFSIHRTTIGRYDQVTKSWTERIN